MATPSTAGEAAAAAAAAGDPHVLRRTFDSIADGSLKPRSVGHVYELFVAPLPRSELSSRLPAAVSRTSEVPLNQSTFSAAQNALLRRISVDWQAQLEWEPLVSAWLFSTPLSQVAALRTLSALLACKDELHPTARDAIVRACQLAQHRITPPALYTAESSPARAQLAWTEAVRLLVSLPDRLANFTAGKVTLPDWYPCLLVPALPRLPAAAATELLLRLDRVGYTTAPPFWSALLAAAASLDDAPDHRLWTDATASAWTRTVSGLPPRERLRLQTSLFGFLNSCAHSQQFTALIHPSERRSPGTLGSRLVSADALAFLATVTRLLTDVFPPCAKSDEPSGADSDSDSDSHSGSDSGSEAQTQTQTQAGYNAARLIRLVGRLLLPRPDQGTAVPLCPFMGWAIATWLTRISAEAASSVLQPVADAWSRKARLEIAPLDENQYLSVLIVCLVASHPARAQPLLRLSTSAAFLNGVSAHLDHPDPLVRRLGMLVAELVSAKTPSENGDTLSFGRSMWDGTGQGRDEARVLRALHDAWDVHCTSVQDILATGVDAQRIAQILGVQRSPERLAVARVKEPRQRRESKPTSRRLPQLKPPPARRPLISVIGEDEDEDEAAPRCPLITTLSDNGDGARVPVSSGDDSSSSSSEASDSDSEADAEKTGTEQSEMARLAADLAGLDPSEAPPLNPVPSTNDEERESHAPSFGGKRVRPPVYMTDLSVLLRGDRASVRVGLKHAGALIRSKAAWGLGGEVHESAVDVALALCALQNTLGIRHLHERRVDALAALVRADQQAAAAVVQQYFHHQYSGAQRIDMLHALAGPATSTATASGAGAGAGVVERAVARARGRRMPLGVVSNPAPAHGSDVGSQGRDTTALVRPLMRRFAAHWADLHRRSDQSYRGAGTAGLFAPDMLAVFFDTLALLVHADVDARRVADEALELVLYVGPAAFPLALVTLDRCLQLDDAASLNMAHVAALAELAQSTFPSLTGRLAPVGAALILRLDQALDKANQRTRRRIGIDVQ